jgi:hypothetical protein
MMPPLIKKTKKHCFSERAQIWGEGFSCELNLSQIGVKKNFSLRNAISQNKNKKLAAPNEVKFVGKYSHLEPFSPDFNLVPLRSRLC